MKCKIKILLFIGLVLMNLQVAEAVVLEFAPSNQTAVPGDNVSLDLRISGLSSGGAPSLGDFDLDITFDVTKLSFTSYSLGSSLGDISLFEAEDFSLGQAGGSINLSELSYLSPGALDALQGSSFTLATLHFTVGNLLSGQTTNVAISNINAVGDGFGNALTVDNTGSANISNGNVINVPEPSAIALIVMVLFGLTLLRQIKIS